MRDAIAAAAVTHPHPNPRVAAAIISPEGGRVALAAHQRAGEPHAERLAIDGGEFVDHAMVVTLEPCAHTGRTPPCTEAIIDAGIREVWVGAVDPDPRVAGAGIEQLRAAGIDVHVGVLTDEVEGADPGYFHQRRTGRAFTTLKLASTLDGNAAAADGTSQWITGVAAREDVHRLRAQHDAVMVGAGTVLSDDPSLDVRLADHIGPQPRPIVVRGSRSIPLDARVMQRNALVVDSEPGASLLTTLEALPEEGILSVFVEGGPTLAGSLLRDRLIDQVVWYHGAKIGGGVGRPAIDGTWTTLDDALDLEITDVRLLGGDVRITARPKELG